MKYSELSSKKRAGPNWLKFAAASLLAVALAGCGGGSDGAAGKDGLPGTPADPTVLNDLTAKVTALTQTANPETCSNCHNDSTATSGSGHQAEYNKTTDASNIVITLADPDTDLVSATHTSKLTFTATQGGPTNYLNAAKINASTFAVKRFYATRWIAGSRVDKAIAYTVFTDVAGTNKIQAAASGATVVFDPVASDAQVYAVLADTKLNTEGSVYDNVTNVGKTYGVAVAATYASAADASSCKTCHGSLQAGAAGSFTAGGVYMKAGYRAAHVEGLQDFGACRSCHVDDPAATNIASDGGHFEWQILKDSPARMAEINAAIATAKAASPVDTAHDTVKENMTTDELAKYAYKKRVMNDVHMAHAMQFPYPQSMQNCATCHTTQAQRDQIFAPANFTAETCISCHAVEGLKTKMKAAAFGHSTQTASDTALRASNCVTCHNGADAPTSGKIHNGGFNSKIYSSTGARYSDAIKVTIDSTTVAANKLTIKFSAKDTGATGFDMAKIKPTVLVGLYGYDTKDFIVAAHASNATDKATNLEYAVGTTHPRFTTVPAAAGTWEVTADLSLWADKIAAGTIKRAEIAVMPYLDHPTLKTTTRAGAVVPDAIGLNAPSVTFNLTTGKQETDFGKIVDAAKCNSCHDQLATTFHTADRGGNVKVCRICHEVSNPGFHLEMQSRSIDSYVHAIHSFQAFDISSIDMTDPVAKMKYESHVADGYPNWSIKNCESCHVPGTYDVPNQAKSMPGVLSGSSAFSKGDRNIGTIAAAVTGPAARACGSCHRSQMINANNGLGDANGLAVLNSHMTKEGYTLENVTGMWTAIVAKLMAMF